MKLEKLKEGMTVYRWARERPRGMGSWPVYIVEVDLVGRRVLASWNGNPARWFSERHAVKWRDLTYGEAQRRKEAKVKP